MHTQHSPQDLTLPPRPSRPLQAPSPPAVPPIALRSGEFKLERRRWPGLLGAAVIGAGLAAMAVSSFYDDRTMGARLDATVTAAESSVKQGVGDLRGAASDAAAGTAVAADRMAGALNDTAITTAVKTSLAADPSLSALKIDVTTVDGVVQLGGPAPDIKSRDRAEMLALAPSGVVRVDNRLVVSPPPATH